MSVPSDSANAAADWRLKRERGSELLMRVMSWLSLRLGRRGSRPLLHVIVPYFPVLAPAARRSSIEYLRRALGREPTLTDRYRHLLSFATMIHDRVYLVNNRLGEFEFVLEGIELFDEVLANGSGALLMGAHVGSFEALSAAGHANTGATVAMAMYEGNALKVNAMLAALNPVLRPQIISLGRMDAMLRLRALLDSGALVGMLADRTLGAEPTLAVQLLGERAYLPVGPMRAAALLRRRVIFMAGIYCGGNRYRVKFAPLADFTATPAGAREAQVGAAVQRFAVLLDELCREAPYNWFNFYDFWRAPPAAGAA